MAENPTQVSEMCTMMGSSFPRGLSLLVLIHTTSRVFKVLMCTFSLQESGQAKTRPARLLAMAIPCKSSQAVKTPDGEA